MKRTIIPILVSLLIVPALGLGHASDPCSTARTLLLQELDTPGVTMDKAAPALQATILACGVDTTPPTTQLGVDTALKVADETMKCEGVNTQTGVLPAAFQVTIIAGGQTYNLPDFGTAVVATTGGSSQTAVFSGDGIYAGVLASQDGALSFPKLAKVLLPGSNGWASAHCIKGVVAGGAGGASLITGGIAISVSGKTLV